ncbi:MAG: stage II sporulation protein M [Candidatus Diapherotrites archaeon]
MRKKTNFFKENYLKSWKYLKETKSFIWIIVILFFVSALIGFFVPIPDGLQKTILDYLGQILERTQGMSQMELIWFILFNNLQSGFFGMIFGFLLGFFPVIITLVNGYVLGYVSSVTVSSAGTSSLLNLLPHGVFELPAIFISLGLGLKFGTFIFRKNKGESFRDFLINSVRVFVFIVIPLLIIAAIIEGGLIFLIK